MRTYCLVAHLLLAVHNESASANHVNITGSSHSVAVAPIDDALVNTMLVDGSTGWRSFDMIQPTAPTALVVAQETHSVLSISVFANVELHLGGLQGSGVIELTASPAALTMGDGASAIASPQCTPKMQSIPVSLLAGNRSSTTRNNVTSLAALPTPTSLFNDTNFNISRLSTFAAPALQSLSGGPAGKVCASSYRSIVAAVASLCFIALS